MAEEEALSLTWDLGRRTDFSNVAAIFEHLNTIVLFSIDVQLALDNQAILARALQARDEFGVVMLGLGRIIGSVSQPEYDEARHLVGREYPRVVLIGANFSNPLNLVVKDLFGFLPDILEVIRDWGPRRRLAKAQASMAEDDALVHRRLTQELVSRIPDLALPQISALLRGAPAEAMLALAELPFQVETVKVDDSF